LEGLRANGTEYVWLCDSGYAPSPTAFRKMLRTKIWSESVFTIFKVLRPTHARAFYENKFTADYDLHDKFGGLRYVKIDAVFNQEGWELDVKCDGRNIDYVDVQATKFSFPYSAFYLASNEPPTVTNVGLTAVQRFYPSVESHYGDGSILDSHREMAERSDSNLFIVFDADLVLEQALGLEEFNDWDEDYVHIWMVRNPINGLIYGHGGPKAFHKKAFLDLTHQVIDVTTSSNAQRIKLHNECVGIHRFNWSAESSFRTAFREAAKLTWAQNEEAKERLSIWLDDELVNDEEQFYEECLDGAQLGHEWAQSADESEKPLLNNFMWLHKQFEDYKSIVAAADEIIQEENEQFVQLVKSKGLTNGPDNTQGNGG